VRCTTKCFNQRERHQCPKQNGPLRRALNCAHRAILWARRSAGWDEPSLNCGGPSPPLNGRPAARNAASPSPSYSCKEPWRCPSCFQPKQNVLVHCLCPMPGRGTCEVESPIERLMWRPSGRSPLLQAVSAGKGRFRSSPCERAGLLVSITCPWSPPAPCKLNLPGLPLR
jgi:hypothetical protein